MDNLDNVDEVILNPFATVTIGLQGLAVYCYNATHDAGDGRRGRWEIAIPRFDDHRLQMNLPGMGVVNVDTTVRKIEIKDRVGVPSIPEHKVEPFDRRNRDTSDSKDCRWLTDITKNAEIPHEGVIMKRKSDFPNRVGVTMLYVYDATLYTKEIERFNLVLGTHAATCPVENGRPIPLPEPQAGIALDMIRDPYGFSAATVGIDIQSPIGGEVDLVFDNGVRTSYRQANGLHRILITNLERERPTDAVVTTSQARYGRGDFFRYYELFVVGSSDHFHLWQKAPLDTGGPEPSSEGDCNGTRGSFGNLDPLL